MGRVGPAQTCGLIDYGVWSMPGAWGSGASSQGRHMSGEVYGPQSYRVCPHPPTPSTHAEGSRMHSSTHACTHTSTLIRPEEYWMPSGS